MEPRNRFRWMNSASLCSLSGRCDNPIFTWIPAPIDFLKIPAQTPFVSCSLLVSTELSWYCIQQLSFIDVHWDVLMLYSYSSVVPNWYQQCRPKILSFTCSSFTSAKLSKILSFSCPFLISRAVLIIHPSAVSHSPVHVSANGCVLYTSHQLSLKCLPSSHWVM